MVEYAEGTLYRNECDRWEFSGNQLTSGSLVEICIDGNWILGVVEFWHDDYYWFRRLDGITVILRSGIKARTPNLNERRILNP